jgi:hypothetical protein
MGFMTAPSGGEFTPYVSFNAKAGRWYTKLVDDKDAEIEEVGNMLAVFDFADLKTGWFRFAANQAPEKTFDTSLTEPVPSPGDGFKRGFQLNLFSEKNLGGVREFSSTAGVAIEAMNSLYDAVIAAPEHKAGQLPVVKCEKVNPIVGSHGTNYQPVLTVQKWVDRPAELDGAANQNSAAKPEPAKATGTDGAAHQPPPASDDDEF